MYFEGYFHSKSLCLNTVMYFLGKVVSLKSVLSCVQSPFVAVNCGDDASSWPWSSSWTCAAWRVWATHWWQVCFFGRLEVVGLCMRSQDLAPPPETSNCFCWWWGIFFTAGGMNRTGGHKWAWLREKIQLNLPELPAWKFTRVGGVWWMWWDGENCTFYCVVHISRVQRWECVDSIDRNHSSYLAHRLMPTVASKHPFLPVDCVFYKG